MNKEYPPEAYRFTDENGETYYSTPQQDIVLPILILLGIANALPFVLLLVLTK